MPYCWATITLQGYNRILAKFQQFCQQNGYMFPPSISAGLAAFLCHIADTSPRPASILRSHMAAVAHFYAAPDMPDLTKLYEISQLQRVLVKSGTRLSRTRSSVLQIDPFMALF